jgi:hypothetical protein
MNELVSGLYLAGYLYEYFGHVLVIANLSVKNAYRNIYFITGLRERIVEIRKSVKLLDIKPFLQGELRYHAPRINGTYALVVTVAVMISIGGCHVTSAVFILIYPPPLEPLGLRQ